MNAVLKLFEKIIFITLIVILAIVVLLATINLAREIVLKFLSNPLFLPDGSVLLEFFGFVLLIVIGIELLETVKTYLTEHVVRIEVVLEVALIATVRKVIIVDMKEFSPLTLFAIAALVIALSAGYYLEKRARMMRTGIRNEQPLLDQEESLHHESTSLFS